MSVWFPLYGRDFLAGTLGWSAEERGHYVTLLVAQWEQDGLPNDLKRLELISPGVKSCWATLESKFPLSRGGKRRNLRLEHERHKAHERSERARQSASKRWSAAGGDSPEADEDPPGNKGDECERICDGICGGICDGACSADASIAISYSPPPPPPPPKALEGWERLRTAWNAAWGEKRQWRSAQPFPEALARLDEPGWLDEAIEAIPSIKSGACSGFKTPPTLRQFCGADDQGITFVAKLLGGEFTDDSIKRRREPIRP